MNKNLIALIDEAIRCYCEIDADGYSLDFSDIDEHDQQKITAAFIEQDDRDLHCLYENTNDIASDLIMLLKTNDDIYFAEQMKLKVVKHYEKRIKELLNERLEELESVDMQDRGFYKRLDRQSGELQWS